MKYQKISPNHFKPVQEFTLRVIERKTIDYRIAWFLYVSIASVAFLYGYTVVYCLTYQI
jgi:hypothetical protein